MNQEAKENRADQYKHSISTAYNNTKPERQTPIKSKTDDMSMIVSFCKYHFSIT